MPDNNSVHLIGKVKRNAVAGNGVIDFSIEVVGYKGRIDIFDCRCTSRSPAFDELEGFVNEGEPIEIIGHLEKRTTTEEQRVCGVSLTVRNTVIFVFVDSVVTED